MLARQGPHYPVKSLACGLHNLTVFALTFNHMRNLSWPSLALVLLSAALPGAAQPNPAVRRDAIVAMANIGQCRGGAYLFS